MRKISLKQIITIVSTLGVLVVNGLANALPLNNLTTGEISDQFAIYFVPAGYVFSIWGLIYLGLIVYTIYQALPAQRENPILNKVAPAYWLSSLANAGWIFFWHYELFPLTLPLMLVILGTLIYTYLQLNKTQGSEKWIVRFPFSIYLGWISVATVANVSQLLFYLEWNGFGIAGPIWAGIMLAIATLLGLIMAWRENDLFYVLVLIWAFIGISISQSRSDIVVISSWVGVSMLFLGSLVSLIKNKKVY
jgi:hypothetical protein